MTMPPATTTSPATESQDRRRAMLRTAFGPVITAALADPAVIEVMINPDGSVRLDRLGQGRIDTGERLPGNDVERIIRLVASHVRREAHADHPVVSAELPGRGDAGQDHPDQRAAGGNLSERRKMPTRLNASKLGALAT
ncbi:MAG TPA: hypothetical protein PKZ97_01150 [Azospirillaceae bacterium]|nr:hypothetical protein [Azospirillaceae bacterium]